MATQLEPADTSWLFAGRFWVQQWRRNGDVVEMRQRNWRHLETSRDKWRYGGETGDWRLEGVGNDTKG